MIIDNLGDLNEGVNMTSLRTNGWATDRQNSVVLHYQLEDLRDSPTSAWKRNDVKPTLRVEESFPIDSNSLLWSRDVGTAL